ncbi:MAG: hypothetical protein HN929_00895, partial [Chloroflexi bacterium]|nr:hypothetical protein [Chloroflexota bacterium]
TLIGLDAGHSWTITADDEGNDGVTYSFTDIENLTGGSGDDSFAFDEGFGITGTLDGGGGTNDTISYADYTTGLSITITANNAGNDGTYSFINIENLTGGTGADSFAFDDGFGLTGALDGGLTGTNTLDYSAYSSDITVDLAGTATNTGGISNIQTITGTTGGNDTLIGLDAGHSWTITADDEGNDGVTYSFTDIENLTGGSGDDSFAFDDGFGLTGALDGGGPAGINTLDLSLYSTTIDITIVSAGSLKGMAGTIATILPNGFDNIDSLKAGSAINDSLDMTALAALSITLTGSKAGGEVTLGAFSGIEILNVTSGSDLTGTANTDTFTTSGVDSGTVQDIAYSGFSSLDGAGGDDVFNIGHTITGLAGGGAGDDTFNMTALVSTAGIEGGTTGEVLGDTLDLTLLGDLSITLIGSNSGTEVTLGTFIDIDILNGTAGSTLNGTVGDDSFTLTGAGTGNVRGIDYSGYDTIAGGTGTDTLTGLNTGQAWTITAYNAGNDGTYYFSSIENLTGGSVVDSFTIADTFGLSGTIDGGGDTDTLSYASYSGAVSIDLEAGTATNMGGISNLETFIGGGASDTLIGLNAGQTWSITVNDAGNDGTYYFTGIENLTGGTLADSFAFANGVGLTGTLDGGSGANTLDYSAYLAANAVTVDIENGTATNTGGISNIQTITGGAGSDTLIGLNSGHSWAITADNTGNDGVVTYSFTSIENLTGGTGVDSFAFANGVGLTGTLDGGSG